MFSQTTSIPVTLTLACLSISQAWAVTVQEDINPISSKALIQFPVLQDEPFAPLLRSTEDHRVEILRELQKGKDTRHGWDGTFKDRKNARPRKDQDDRSTDDTGIPTVPESGSDNGSVTFSNGLSPIQPGSLDTGILESTTQWTSVTVTAVPLPAAAWLFLSGIMGFGAVGNIRRR